MCSLSQSKVADLFYVVSKPDNLFYENKITSDNAVKHTITDILSEFFSFDKLTFYKNRYNTIV